MENLRVLVAPVLLGFIGGQDILLGSLLTLRWYCSCLWSSRISFWARPRKLQQNLILLVLLIRALVSVLFGLTLHQESFFTPRKLYANKAWDCSGQFLVPGTTSHVCGTAGPLAGTAAPTSPAVLTMLFYRKLGCSVSRLLVRSNNTGLKYTVIWFFESLEVSW